ncbi:hypothetical protein H1R17_04420 [Flavobacterium sp. xlx-214]|uniref:hypothetical protein n=1 Tax=unclassified Flavobacterium TaxID=196869 RepID=UPI0013CF7DA6|nr:MULTISPECIES: hypothetical protein [unclassified Flavobacterium]MBA5792137.1 hypothetical protein [Flavobacterium sp. xlx-221]QMI84383.1 hypothetical protein H1R17_04420 [Flavobacterium sp. xlx-214]
MILKIIFEETLFEMLNVIYDKNSLEIKTFLVVISLLTIFLISLGIYINNNLCLVIGISMLVNIPFLLIEKGIEFDKKENKYRFFKSLFGFKLIKNKWLVLPNIKYLSVYKAKKTQEAPMGVNYNYTYYFIYEINIFDENQHYFTLFKIDITHLKHALFCAKEIANYFNTSFIDATTTEHKWL